MTFRKKLWIVSLQAFVCGQCFEGAFDSLLDGNAFGVALQLSLSAVTFWLHRLCISELVSNKADVRSVE